QVYVRLWTRINGAWLYEDSILSTRPIPRIAAPKPGMIGVSAGGLLRWNSVQGAQQVIVDLGSSLGASDLLMTNASGTSMSMPGLPPMQAVYARVWMWIGGQWSYDDTVFSTLNSLNSASMVYPTPGGYA